MSRPTPIKQGNFGRGFSTDSDRGHIPFKPYPASLIGISVLSRFALETVATFAVPTRHRLVAGFPLGRCFYKVEDKRMNRRKFLKAATSSSMALIAVPIFATELQFNEIYSLKCLGNINGPRYLDGHTHDGTVTLVRDLVKPFSGTKWQLVRAGNGTVAFRCRGDIEGLRWLDGRTHNGTVGLAPTANAPFTGTRWQIVAVPGGVNLKCLGNIEGPRFLDGRTNNGSVGLAKTTDPPFTGTRWELALDPHCIDDPCPLP